jgi:hypothetical protein
MPKASKDGRWKKAEALVRKQRSNSALRIGSLRPGWAENTYRAALYELQELVFGRLFAEVKPCCPAYEREKWPKMPVLAPKLIWRTQDDGWTATRANPQAPRGKTKAQFGALSGDHHYVPLLMGAAGIGWVLGYTIASEIGDI